MSKEPDETLKERNSTHGDFAEQAAMTQAIKRVFRSGKNWERFTDDQKEAAESFAIKMGRALTGDPNHADSWHDIAGYARLVEKILLGETV